MRTEQQMFDLILGVARQDERIRAVYMNGSRTNPHAPKDIFQDYDMVYVVTETASFLQDREWIRIFGDLIMIQEPNKLDQGIGRKANFDRSYVYLMLFRDGNRIDLSIETIESMMTGYVSNNLTIPLLDKDQCLPPIPPPTDIDYHVKKPTEPHFESCTNDFWWCLQNVAKGIWRDELPYAKQMFEETTRASLDEMIQWWIGTQHDFQVSAGKMGKYYKNYLPDAYWELYKGTFSGSDYTSFWDSIFIAGELFRELGKDVAAHCQFTYPIEDDTNMTEYLKHVRNLPADAKEIFED